ncbi:MAG: FxsA family protein [Pseudomonadales bacterium]
MRLWFLVFFATPIVEMYLLIQVGGYIGAWPTIGLVMLTAVAGVALLRVQGPATLRRGMGRLQAGELPAQEVAEGLLLAVAGALLLTPGFFTDGVGFLLLLPATRIAVARRILARAEVMGGPAPGGPAPGARRDRAQRGPVVIEGEFESRSDEPRDGDRNRNPERPEDEPPPRQGS